MPEPLLRGSGHALVQERSSIVPPSPDSVLTFDLQMIHPSAIIGRNVEIGEDAVVDRFAVIGDGSRIGANCFIASHVVIGSECEIGAGSVLHPHAVLYPGIRIGAGSVIDSGACIGSDGFGFVWDGTGFQKIPQVGACEIRPGLRLGANSAVDRGSVGHTRIGGGASFASLVHIGHNAVLGDRVHIAAHSGVAGSAVIGDDVGVGAQVAIVGHLAVGDGVRIASWGGITHDTEPGQDISGVPGRPAREARYADRLLMRLPRIIQRFRALESALSRDVGARKNR